MGEFHCIPSGCATVAYREYLPPLVRWRYEDEDWQEIEGDDYAIAQSKGQDCSKTYAVTCDVRAKVRWHSGYAVDRTGTEAQTENIQGKIIEAKFDVIPTNSQFTGAFVVYEDCNLNTKIKIYWSATYKIQDYDQSNTYCELVDIVAADGSIENSYQFTIYKNGAIVHQETRNISPEAEILPCRLSDKYIQIKIEKFPYLSAIQVLPYARDAEKIKGIPYPVEFIKPIPDECLNIYRAEIFDPLPSGAPEEENEPVFADYITQICSAPGCPPPEYEVICDECNDCRSCPDNSCAVECRGQICCYDTATGKAIESIPIEDYCGE